MDLAKLIQEISAFILAAKSATTWAQRLALIPALLKIIQDALSLLPATPPSGPVLMASPSRQAAFTTCQSDAPDSLLTKLEDECNLHRMASASAKPQGPFIDAILPILLSILQKWLGF